MLRAQLKEMEFYLWMFVQMFLDCLIILCHIGEHIFHW